MITDYDYEEYFYTGAHHKNLLFVEQSANVTKVSGMPPKITMPSGAGPAVTITNDNMIEEQFELVESLNSAENWSWGSVEPSMVTFDIREDGRVPIIEDHIFRLYLYFDGDSDTLMYVGSYVFDQDKLSDDAKTRSISGFDFMQGIRDTDIIDFYRGLFNAHEEPDPEDPEHTIWVPGREKITVLEARNKLFEYLAEEEGFPIIQETVELPNDTFEFAFDVDTEALSAGQFLEDICEINGRYGHFGRQLSTAQATKNYQIFQYIRVERYDEDGTKIANDMRIEGISKGLYETKSIGRLRVYNRDSVRIAYYDEGYKKSYSKYNIYDNILIDDLTKSKTTKAALKTMLQNIYDSIRYRKYVPFTAKTPADLCREVGDRITLWTDLEINTEEGLTKKFKTLIFERKITGIQNMVDTYSAKGDKKLPEFGDYTSSGGYSASTTGKKAKKGDKEKTKSDGKFELEDCTTADFVEYLRNVGIRLLDEPSDVSVEYIPDSANRRVEIKWSDPPDITDYKPMPCEWEGTVIVRSEGKPAKQRWGGTKIDAFHVRDEHKTTAFADTSVEIDKEYYYSIMPYYVYMDDDDHPRRHYTWTCIYKVTTYAPMPKPVINSITVDGTDVTINYTIEAWNGGNYTQCKVVAKKKKIPQDISDGTGVSVSIGTGNTVTMTGLDELTNYYFVIFIEDTEGNTASSEPQSCITEQMPKFNITSIANAGTCFIVNYRINDYSTIENYRDIKLVAKANGIPSNKNDGYTIDITNNFYESQDSSWSNVDNEVAYIGLPNAESYGFKIFADDDISNSMIKETTQGTSPYIMNVLIWFSGASNVGRPEQDRHYGYIPCYFAVPISQIDYQVGIWTDESDTKFGNFYIRNTKDGENLISQEFSGSNSESPKTFTCELSEAISGLKWLVFNDPANSGWNPAVLKLAFYI